MGAIFGSECEKRGMLVRVAGDNIMMSPPLIISSSEVDEVRFRHDFRMIFEHLSVFVFSPSFRL